MSVVIFWHPGAPWGLCLKSLYYWSGSTLVIVHPFAESVNSSLFLWYFEILPKTELWKRLHSYPHMSTSAGQKGLVHRQSYILHIIISMCWTDQDAFTHQCKWIFPVLWRSLVWQWNQNSGIHVYHYTNVLQSNWEAFNKHHASIEVDLSYVDSSVKPWWMPEWT